MVDEPDKPKSPDKPKRDPAKHSKKDPAKPTRAKASRPDYAPTPAGRWHNRRAGNDAGPRNAVARGPAGIRREGRRGRDLDAASAATAREVRRRAAARHQIGFRTEGRPTTGDRRTGRGRA